MAEQVRVQDIQQIDQQVDVINQSIQDAVQQANQVLEQAIQAFQDNDAAQVETEQTLLPYQNLLKSGQA